MVAGRWCPMTLPTADRTPCQMRCMDCSHVFTVAYLPMPMETFAKIAKSARCPMCGVGAKRLSPCHTGEDAASVMAKKGPTAVVDTARIHAWLLKGERGLSSETMARAALGIRDPRYDRHPLDPDDLRRCMLLVDQAPEVRNAFPRIAQLSKTWAAIIAHWDELIALLREEMPSGMARKTYDRMKALGC